ncbi:MAG TPA: hypothetical protein VMB21_12885 [Candidatus Limnocylindria bacterium]|nr:hypothetical protein [Candidatus Limnocylindria bacterium]
MVRVDDFVAVGSRLWLVLAGLILTGRTCDLLSTWIATPNLVLEGNPVARRLGWKFGVPLNFVLALVLACWPLPAIALTTTSLLVAARNLQSAWVMRTLGEHSYRCWMSDRMAECPRGLAWACFLGEAGLFTAVGGALMWFARWQLVPFGVGLGMAAYGFAVALFTSISLWRLRH